MQMILSSVVLVLLNVECGILRVSVVRVLNRGVNEEFVVLRLCFGLFS